MYTTILLVYRMVRLRIRYTEKSIGRATFHYWCYLCDILISLGKCIGRLHNILTLIHLLLLICICEVGAAMRRRLCRCKLLGLFCKYADADLFRLRLLILRIFATKTTISSKVFLVILELLLLGSPSTSKER